MSILNFVCPQSARWMLGNLDITPILDTFSVRQPLYEHTTSLIWRGNLSVVDRAGVPFGESLSELENPQRWERCQQPLTLSINNKKVGGCWRISRYRFNEDTYTGEAELTDKLGLLDWVSPPEELEGIEAGRLISWEALVKKCLLKAAKYDKNFPPFFTESDIIFDNPISNTEAISGSYLGPIIKINGSFIKFAQEIAGAHGRVIWVDTDEKIRITPYPKALPSQPIIALCRQQVDRFERINEIETPYTKIIVTGSKDVKADCDEKYPKTRTTYGSMGGFSRTLLHKESIDKTKDSDFREQFKSTVLEAAGQLFPDVERWKNNATLITAEKKTEDYWYDRQGRLIRSRVNKGKPYGVVFDSDEYEGNVTLLTDAEREESEYEFGDDNVIKSERHTKWSRFPISATVDQGEEEQISYTGLMIAEIVERHYLSDSGRGTTVAAAGGNSVSDPKAACQRWSTRTVIRRRGLKTVETNIVYPEKKEWVSDGGTGLQLATTPTEVQSTSFTGPGELILIEDSTEPDTTPGTGKTKHAKKGSAPVVLKGECDVFPINFSLCSPRELTINIDRLSSNANAKYMAELLGGILWQRRYGRQISHPISDWFIDKWRPFARADIHNGSFVMDGVSIVAESSGGTTQARIDWTGNYAGKISPIPCPILPIPPLPIPVVNPDCSISYTFTPGSFPTQTTAPNGQVTIPLPTVPGASYTPTNLPPGVEIEIDETGTPTIIGSPTTPGTYPITIEIDDNGTITIIEFDIVVENPPVIEPVYGVQPRVNITQEFELRFYLQDYLIPDLDLYTGLELSLQFELGPPIQSGREDLLAVACFGLDWKEGQNHDFLEQCLLGH